MSEKALQYVFRKYGDIPLVISVPHGGMEEPEHFIIRSMGNRRVDMYTLDFALELESSLREGWGSPYMAAGLLRRCIIDYNRPAGEAFEDSEAARHYHEFHSSLVEFIEQARQAHGACLLLDIHGRAGRDRPHVVLGTGNYTGMGPEMVRDLCELIYRQGWEVRHDTTGPYRGGFIVRNYSDSRLVCGVQLEISREIREDESLRRSFSSSLGEVLYRLGRLYYVKRSPN